MDSKEEKQYTKGEWYLQTEADAYTNIVRCNNGKGFETIYIGSCAQSSSVESQANAQLMAAAPDLLEALQAMLSRFKNTDVDMVKASHVKNLAEKAINKALTIQPKSVF